MTDATQDVPLILVIDDVSPVVRLIELELSTQGFSTTSVLIHDEPVAHAMELQPAAIVLGSSLPSPQVYDVLVQLKSGTQIPVLFIHVGGNDNDAALALDMGADDTLGQPFNPEDLSLRLKAMLDVDLPEARPIVRGPMRIDVLHRLLFYEDRKVAVGTSEWALVLALAQNDAPVPAQELLITVWGKEFEHETTFLRLWIDRLRIHLGDDPDSPKIVLGDLETGYFLGV